MRRILTVAALLFALGVVILVLIPAKYAATALVIVDPREQRVTADQEVLPGIGQDAAALQSLVEIANSDGFLQPLIEKLKVADDGEIAGGETNPARILERFRKHLDISRRGLTYVIAFTFTSKDPRRAADYANAIASAFVASQTEVRTAATDEAADWLSSRLKTLSDKLRKSEDAVAAFKTQYRIVDAGKESTTRQLRVTELSQQVSAARLQAEEARNRYEQAQRDLQSNVDGSTGSKSDLLTVLRAQLNQLNDQIAQKKAVLGDRHPDLMISYNQLAELKRQIDGERRRILANAKSDYEAAADRQKTLEGQLKQLEGEMLTEGQAAVKLQELRRDADANRAIYEQFLARYNATNQQRLLQASQTKVASAATLPTRPTRPPMSLLLAALAILSLIGGAGGVAGLDAYRGRKIGSDEADATAVPVPQPVAEAPPAPAVQAPPQPVTPPQRPEPRAEPAAPAVDPVADTRATVLRLFDAIGVAKGRAGKVALVTSVDAAGGRGLAQALNDIAVDRGLLSVVIDVTPGAGAAQETGAANGRQQVRVLATPVRSVLRLLSGPEAGQGDIRGEFNLVLIKAPPLPENPDVAEIAAHTDYNLLAAGRGVETAAVQRAQASLARFSRTPVAVVTNIANVPLAVRPAGTRLAG